MMRVTFLWAFLLALALIASLYAADDTPTTPESTSPVNARDQDPVIQQVRGLRNSGMKLNDAKDLKGAIEKLRQAIALLHKRVFGEERHEITDPKDVSQDAALYAQILNDYGSILIRAKQYDEAIEVLEDSLAMVKKIYGNSHPSLGLSLRSLADAYLAKEKYQEAIDKYKLLQKHITKGLGVTHEAYIEASLKIAEAYKKMGNDKKALKVLKKTVKAQGGEINGLTKGIAELYMELSTAHLALNEVDEAQNAAETAKAIFLQRDGDETLAYAFSLNALAGVKMRQQKVDDAIELLEQAHRIALQLFGEDDPIPQESAKTLKQVKQYKLDLQAQKDEL